MDISVEFIGTRRGRLACAPHGPAARLWVQPPPVNDLTPLGFGRIVAR
ncbi:MAG: hypothetical protein LC119_12485 [Burkholderiales bacterium]|nr:hypothetical protein [Burkholderiales bacterium]